MAYNWNSMPEGEGEPGAVAETPIMVDPNKAVTAATKKPRSYYDLMLSLADLGSKEKGLKSQGEIAEELRKTAMPGMRTSGRIMRAAHPLEFLASGVDRYQGVKQRREVLKGQEELANEIRRRIQEERMKDIGVI